MTGVTCSFAVHHVMYLELILLCLRELWLELMTKMTALLLLLLIRADLTIFKVTNFSY